MIIATAQGMLARFSEGEVRPMGRDAGGVIGIRLLARKDDNVVVDDASSSPRPTCSC